MNIGSKAKPISWCYLFLNLWAPPKHRIAHEKPDRFSLLKFAVGSLLSENLQVAQNGPDKNEHTKYGSFVQEMKRLKIESGKVNKLPVEEGNQTGKSKESYVIGFNSRRRNGSAGM